MPPDHTKVFGSKSVPLSLIDNTYGAVQLPDGVIVGSSVSDSPGLSGTSFICNILGHISSFPN